MKPKRKPAILAPREDDNPFIQDFKHKWTGSWNPKQSVIAASDLGGLFMAIGDWASAADIGELISVEASPHDDYQASRAIHQAAYAYRRLGRPDDERRMYGAAPVWSALPSSDPEVHRMEIADRMDHIRRLGTDPASFRHLFTAVGTLCGELAEVRTGGRRSAWLPEEILENQLSEALRKLRAAMEAAAAES